LKESLIQNQIHKALLRACPGLLLWRNSVGLVKHGNRFVHYGLSVGSSDLIGVLNGRFVAVEVKTAKGRLSDAQKKFIDRVNEAGALAIVARSPVEAVEKIKNGAQEKSFGSLGDSSGYEF